MNDLELMYLLEREGYEPTLENLKILKEEIIDDAERARRERAIDSRAGTERERAIDIQARRHQPTDKEKNTSSDINYKNIIESFSDYELYQILEYSGYRTTERNLFILKEGLDSGRFILTEARSIVKKIGSDNNAVMRAYSKHEDDRTETDERVLAYNSGRTLARKIGQLRKDGQKQGLSAEEIRTKENEYKRSRGEYYNPGGKTIMGDGKKHKLNAKILSDDDL